MKKLLMLAFAMMLLLSPQIVRADEPVDVAKISCKELVDSSEQDITLILMWLDGYISAKSNNTLMDDAWVEKLGQHLGEYCAAHPKKTIMDAVKAMD